MAKMLRCAMGLKALILCTITAIGLSGCDDSRTNDEVQRLTDQLKGLVDKAQKKVSEITPDREQIKELTTEELEKLYQLEYKVLEVDKNLPASRIQEELDTIGKERWECFDVEETGSRLRLMCKRFPKSYLRYIPKVF